MESKIAVSKKDNDVPKDLECSICGDIFDKAVSLKACGHTYCSVCIRNHWVTTSRPGVHRQSKKECPLCRTPVGHNVDKALVINREIQEAVKAFKSASLSPPPSTKIGNKTNEPPIQKRIQSRNYAGMQRNGKKELQRICKEYRLATSGNEQELVDRLRCFECMWNAELDTTDTPLTPSELVAKFKKKERMLREERSRDVMTGKINDAKYMKKLTSSLLDDENKRNDKSVSATSSGNATFDAKFKSNFAELIAQGRRRMKKESYWSRSSPRKGVGLRTYDDDGIHDGPKRNANINASCDDDENTKTSLAQTPGGDSTKIESSVGDPLSQKKKMHVYNPYKSDKKRKLQNTTSFAIGSHVPNKPRTLTQPRSSQSPKETTIYNPYKKKPSNGSITVNNVASGKFDSASCLSQSSQCNLHKSQSGEINCRDRIPLGRATSLSLNTNISGNTIDESKNARVWSNLTEMNSSINSAQKKNIRNPYK